MIGLLFVEISILIVPFLLWKVNQHFKKKMETRAMNEKLIFDFRNKKVKETPQNSH